ncbi:class I SAM-dependent methyltransferase [Acidobacteria bacterium AH-259-D05]|nr:class I SAM-dependent methyltransferase [Acidobacteria bacterium AH-259-D05]
MIEIAWSIGRYGKRLARRLLPGSRLHAGRIVGELVWNRVGAEPHLQPLVDEMTDEQARMHFGEEEVLEAEHLRRVVRYFHAWRVYTLRQRIGSRLADARILDVGDTDGLILKHLGKSGIGFNLSAAAVHNIESNGIEAHMGDGHSLPFENDVFDYAFCFETLEHVENPHHLLIELSRVCRPDGRVFISIPWVPRTFVHARDLNSPRGAMHVFEFCRDDFEAVLTHTPLQIAWEDVCNIVGEPSTLTQRLVLHCHRKDHIIGDTFRRFQFFELTFPNGE